MYFINGNKVEARLRKFGVFYPKSMQNHLIDDPVTDFNRKVKMSQQLELKRLKDEEERQKISYTYLYGRIPQKFFEVLYNRIY